MEMRMEIQASSEQILPALHAGFHDKHNVGAGRPYSSTLQLCCPQYNSHKEYIYD
jgi:hypothetical protein